jgi:hypothetical protein
MDVMLRSIRYHSAGISKKHLQFKRAIAMLIMVLPIACTAAQAQNTTISGTVYDPRGASGLPLSNVLVYVTTGTVAPLPAGVQCLTTASTPTGAVSFTDTAVDGTFTLTNVPENTTYTLVIQAGKWRRQFPNIAVGTTALTAQSFSMPANHTQGDIPLVAVVTGEADGVECIFRQMGIADTEFTDDNGTVNPGGRIHLYKGSGNPGVEINSSTPAETVLMTNSTLLNGYDMVMFPCQGGPYDKTAAAQSNLLNYANAGGRVFTTHYSYVWLDPNSPYDSQFPAVANWDVNQSDPTPDPGVATINTSFTDGGNLAQWLQNAGASFNNTEGQIEISTLRRDFNGVIAPTQSWLTDNDSAEGNPVMQMTFNTPVGAAAASQCGRVMFNEYHVFNQGVLPGALYPTECPKSIAASSLAQADMLEYALFDLSTFVQPVVVPTLTLSFSPSPLIVKAGDTADQLTITATDTSSTVDIDSSATLTVVLPQYVTATAMTDTNGGWICNVSTLTCTRTTNIASSTTDSVVLTLSVGSYPSGFTGSINAAVSSPTFSSNVLGTDALVFQQTPTVAWAAPASIVYGTALSATQLDATASVPGSFVYSPAAGAVLSVGQHTLMVTFTPTDTTDYLTATGTTTITILPAIPQISLAASANSAFLSNPVTFSASLSSPGAATQPTGTVTFFDGTTQLGMGTIAAGVATYTTSSLTFGIHSITAVYSGDSSFQPATSSVWSENIEDFTIALQNGTGTVTVPLGGQAVYPMTIAPLGGPALAGPVTFTVATLPPDSTAAFNPVTVPAGSGSTSASLVVNMPGAQAYKLPGAPWERRSLPVALGLILLPFIGRLRKGSVRMRKLAALALFGIALAAGVSGCGANYTAVSFPLTITATSGTLSHTLPVKLVLQ